MKKYLLLAASMALIVGCSLSKEVVDIYKGDPGKDGTSCSVAQEMSEGESQMVIGARISCTDGSFSVIYNGQNGSQGIQGIQGNQGVQGPVGQTGAAAEACQAYRSILFNGVWLSCPGQFPVLISDGRDGRNGRDGDDGASCSSTRDNAHDRVRITCGNTVTYVYDGEDGKDGKNGTNGTNGSNGKSCTVTAAPGGANVKCGNDPAVFLANGAPGAAGTNGTNGRDGLNGTNGEDAVRPGVTCNVHNLSSWDGNTSLPQTLANNPPVGSFTLANFSVGDSPSSAGFPGMPANLQSAVGLEGYALDCSGYINVPTSGVYNFSLMSDDGSRLLIEDNVIIENQGLHAPATVSANATLNRGFNRINVVYYQGPHTQIALQLKWSGPNTSSQVVPASALTHQ